MTQMKHAELEEYKSKLDATESKCAKLSAKLEVGAASSTELEAELKEANAELQNMRHQLDEIRLEKDALAIDLNDKLATVGADLKVYVSVCATWYIHSH